MQNRRLEPMGRATPGGILRLMGTGPDLAHQESASRDFGWVGSQTNPFLGSSSGLLAGYPDPLLTLALFVYANLLSVIMAGGTLVKRAILGLIN